MLRDENSRGGSAFMHEKLKVGDTLVISQPVNLFPIDLRGRKHILMAGGIGITPFMAMMDQMDREAAHFELHYAMRSRSHGAYWQELAERYGATASRSIATRRSSSFPSTTFSATSRSARISMSAAPPA